MRIVTCDQMRMAETGSAAYGISPARLMENAGSAAAALIQKQVEVRGKRCVILSGKGGNGGDGFVVARKLLQAEAEVTVILADGQPKSDLSASMLEMVRSLDIPVLDNAVEHALCLAAVSCADILVDAVYGIGFSGDPPTRLRPLFEAVNLSPQRTYALDIPSGLSADTGRAGDFFIKADHTIAFEALGPGHLLEPAKSHCGHVTAVGIGIPPAVMDTVPITHHLTTMDMVQEMIPPRSVDAHKGDLGRLLNVAGAVGMAGAALLSTKAALRSGAGLVTLASPASLLRSPLQTMPEALTLPLPEMPDGALSPNCTEPLLKALEGIDAVTIGCGLGQSGGAFAALETVLRWARCPVVIDADGINLVAEHIDMLEGMKAPAILTPHPGEMARLLGRPTSQILHNRPGHASAFSRRHGVITVLKGATTVIALPDGRIYLNPTGNPGMATGGSGDVLTGIIGALLAAGAVPEEAAIAGVYLHGLAGDLCAREFSKTAMLPGDLCDHGLPRVFLGMGR